MSPERWQRLGELFRAALPMEQHERRAYLAQACADDEELRREAESLLAADVVAADGFLRDDASPLGMQMLADEEPWRNEMNAATTEIFEAEISIGTKLKDRYEIIEKLDAGGMGEIYKARDLEFPNRLVVVKVLKKESRHTPWIVKKFRDEGQALGRVQHPNVATVLDKGRLPSGEHYLVMEFIAGQTLRQLLTAHQAEGRQPDFPLVAEIMKQAGRAVAAIHQARLIHRDLKPENLMVQNADEADEPLLKVIDFGIVRDLDKSTVAGQIVGTAHYIPPELLRGEAVTPAADIYALGVIAYELLTGCRPFNPQHLGHLLELQKGGVKVKPSALRHGLPEAADRVILQALAYEPSHRPPSARQFGDELARALLAEPPPPPPRLSRRWYVVASVAMVIVIAAVLWGMVSSSKQAGADGDKLLPPGIVIKERPTGNNPLPMTAASANQSSYLADAQFPTEPPPPGTVYATIGFTVWRTRPATTRDGEDAARETIDSQEMAAERIADTIADGDRLYLGIESLTGEFLPDKGGYLYVINREQYDDGTFGRARLIFPTLLTYAGQNRVKPGQPIVLPETNRPFIIKRSSPAQVAETYIIILSPWEFWLPEPLSNKAMVLPDNLVADWEKQYGGRMHRAALRGGVGQARTKREQVVGSRGTFDTAEPLTKDDPLPQTSYRSAVKKGSPAMVRVALRFRG